MKLLGVSYFLLIMFRAKMSRDLTSRISIRRKRVKK